MRFSDSIVDGNCAAKRVHRSCRLAVAIEGQSELVENARRTIVEREVALVLSRSGSVLAQRGLHIAQQLDRTRCRSVEKRRLAEVAQRSGVVAAPAIGVASFERGEHGVRGLTERQCRVADRNQTPKLPLPTGVYPDQHRRRGDRDRSDGKNDGSLHRRPRWYTEAGLGLARASLGRDPEGTYRRRWGLTQSRTVLNFMGTLISGGLVKNAGAVAWSEVDTQEAALIARCNTGDQAACADLVAIHQRMVYSLALHLLGDRDEALDLSQEVFLRVFRTLSSFRGQSALRTWIYRIVINQARNRQRWWRRRHRSDVISLDDHLQQFGDVESKTEVLPDRQLASKEASARIWQALDRLPFDQRTALILREVDGLRYDEIAFSLGVAVGTVKSRLTRARQSLRAELLGLRT